MRNLAIIVISMVLTVIVIGNAYYQKKQFYPSVVYITKSNPSLAIIYIQAFITVIILGKLMRKIFFGELRAVELEHLVERSWYAITETCLAFTVFRDDFNPKFLALFTFLLFFKAFHWLADERVDYMERSPVISWLFHIRIVSILILLGILDILFVCHAYQSTLNRGASVQLVFGFEYAILFTSVLNIVIKYAFHVNDFHELPWENKAVFLLYTELIMGFIKVILYFSFVIIMVRIYTLPLFAFRPMYYTVRAFKKAVNDVVLSRRAIRNMNTLYPDATAEELAAMDNVCIICREEMRTGAKKLPCNHIFHTACLRSWFQRQQTCPTCRFNILRTPTSPSTGVQNAVGPAAAAGGAPAAMAGIPPGGAGAPVVVAAGADVGGVPAPNNAEQTPRFRDRTGPSSSTSGPNETVTGQEELPRPRDRNVPTGMSWCEASTAPVPGELPRPRDRPVSTGVNWYEAAAAAAAATSQGNNNSERSGTSASTSNLPGFIPTPFPSFAMPENIPLIPPYPFMVFNVPPPMPPPEGLNDEELRRLEQSTRESLEQRIRCLLSIQNMLDTAVLMMQQYCAAAAVSSSTSSSHEEQDTATLNTAIPVPREAEVVEATSSRDNPSGNCSTSEDSACKISLDNLSEETVSGLDISESGSEKPADVSCSSSSSTSEQQILRQRRLEKFSKTN